LSGIYFNLALLLLLLLLRLLLLLPLILPLLTFISGPSDVL